MESRPLSNSDMLAVLGRFPHLWFITWIFLRKWTQCTRVTWLRAHDSSPFLARSRKSLSERSSFSTCSCMLVAASSTVLATGCTREEKRNRSGGSTRVLSTPCMLISFSLEAKDDIHD
ncbi:hypothetical protein E2C01_009490 [Portunus trituberculatus]|uniref:Uncharacterized protein n=1 Tax=Portunus trituberculatus TaxID=210409 RepID=A0A5B7D5X6_PORTR|nr:hypothetical protein [Portunus trituberculatus]